MIFTPFYKCISDFKLEWIPGPITQHSGFCYFGREQETIFKFILHDLLAETTVHKSRTIFINNLADSTNVVFFLIVRILLD